MIPANTPTSEPDFSQLGPATRLAIRTGLQVCEKEIRLLEEKLTFKHVRGRDRTFYERELHGWRDAHHRLLTQHHPKPYVSGQRESGRADDGGASNGDAIE